MQSMKLGTCLLGLIFLAVLPASLVAQQPIVVKFSHDGKVLLTLGRAGVAGDGTDTFNQPSDVITAPNGDIFVADGHGGNTNARIVKFDKNGKFIMTWGKKGTAPGEFDTPHSLAMDPKQQPTSDLRSERKVPGRVEAVQPNQRAVHQKRYPLRRRLGVEQDPARRVEERHQDREH